MDFFKGIGNFFGGLFGGNKDDEERKRKQQQAQQQAQSKAQPTPMQGNGQGAGNWLDASPLTAQPFKPQNNMPIQQGQQNSLVSLVQNKPQPPKPTQPQPQLPPKPQPQPQLNKGVLDMEQSFKIKNNAPKPQPLTNITNSIPNYNVMSPEKQRQAIADVYDPPEARLARLSKKMEDDRKMRDGVKDFMGVVGNIPVVNTGANLSTWLASAAGELTGNKSLRDTADNTRNMINLGMTNQELNALPKGQRDKLSTVGNVASALSPLDVWGATSIAKAPIIGGVKQAAKEGIMSEAGKNILKQTAKETGKQYGTQIAIGAGAGGAIDPAIQAYVNDGKVDWSSVPSSMLQGGLWAAVLPEFSEKSRLTKSMDVRGNLVHDMEPSAPATRENSPITRVEETPAQKPSGISTPNRPKGMNKAQNFPTKTEPQPVVTQPVPRPEPQPVQPRPEPAYQTPPQTLQDAIGEPNAQLAPQRPVEPVQAPESPLQPIQRQLDEQSLEPPRQEVVTPPQVVDTPAQVQARQVQELNATQPKLTPEQVADINAQKALADAPTEAMAREAQAPAPQAPKVEATQPTVAPKGAPIEKTPQVGKTAPAENTPKTLYRGTTKREVDALLAGKQKPESLETNIFGETIPKNTLFVTDDINLAKNYSERAAVTRKPHLDGGYIIEYKNTANTKAQSSISKEAGSSVVQQNPNEFYAKDLTLDDVARITDKDGNVVYDASTPRQKPAPRQTDDIVKNGGQGAIYTDPKTGKQTYLTEDELLEELIRLQDIPLAQRTGAEATSLADIRKVLNKNRAAANTTPPQVGKTDPISAIKAESKRFGYDKGYLEEGQIANTIDELMKEQNAIREVGIPLVKKYKSQLDGTKSIEQLMTSSELKAYRAAEAKSDKASKLLKDYFDYKKTLKPDVAPQVGKTDPLEALKAEARKYKSAEDFGDSLNAMKYGKVTGVGQLPVSKINKTQIKALTERGLPHTDTNLKVSDFKPGRQVTQPLEVYSKGGSWVVENGNHRLAQALANGDETVPVVFKGGEGKKYSTPITDLYNQAHSQPTPTTQAPKPQTNTPKQKPPVGMKPLEEATERGAKDQIKKDAQNVAKGEWAMKSLDEAAKKQKKSEPAKSLKEPIDTKPPVDDSPAPTSTKSGENYLQRTVSSDSSTSDVKRRLMSISDSVDSNDIDEIMDNIPKASQKIKDQIRKHYDTIEASERGINRIQKEFRTDVADGSTGKISREVAEEMAHKRNKYTQDMQIAEKNLQSLIRKVEGRQSFKKRMLNSASNLVSYQQGNMLAGLPTQEKNIIGDIVATATQGVRHPIKTIKGVPEARFGSEMKKALRETTQVLPKTVSEVPRYIIRSVLSPVYAVNNSLANVRGAVFRSTAARTELARAGFKNPTKDQIRVQELRAGNAREVLINLNKNVGSTIVDPYKAAKASDEYFKVLDTATSHKDLARFAENTRKSSGILQEMMAGKNANGEVTPMSLLVNTLYPFTNPAINAGKKAIYMLDPRKASHVNEIKSILQSPTQRNVARMQKMAGTAASIVAISQLLDDGVIAYNDEQTTGDVSKPAGWSIKTGDDTYVPVRALGMFEPFVAAVGVTYKVMNGEVKTPEDGMAMMANSLPVVGANQFYGDAVRDIAKGDFTGYGVQSQAINRVKNLVPGVNNGLNRWMDRNQGKSTDSFSAYASKKDASGKTVPDFSTWLGNSVKMGFGDTEGLKPSLTTAGQRRTADNQGAFVKKTINDPATKQHNGAISSLTKYAQEQGLGKTMDDMFGTFDSDTGESKGGHFNTIQSAIWANTGKGGKETMLKSDKKMYDLSQQVLNGVRGDGDELLTIGGENLYSDVSMPNSKGSKNSSKPVSMASVKNAIAAASLPSDKKDELYQISQEASGLYDRRKAGEISWDDEQKMRSELADRERAIVQSSDGVKKLNGLMDKLEKEGFFEEGGLGSTRSGQTYLWNSLNAMLGEKGKTPAADWDDNKSSSGKGGRRSGGRSGSGSGSGGKARGYNMPTSLLSSKSNSAPDIKRGERLFKTPTLVSTAEKTKSRIPNISVKKGIHL